MAASSGRKLQLIKNDQVLLGMRETSPSINATPIDITTKEDEGYRTLHTEDAEDAIDITFGGITKDEVLKNAIINGTDLMLTDVELVYPDGTKLSGDFFFSNFDNAAEYNDAISFTGTMMSSGQQTTIQCIVETVGTVPDQVAQVGQPFSLDMSQYFTITCT